MPSLRYDVTTGDFVVFASERGRRPDRFEHSQRPPPVFDEAYEPGCPFCVGHEGESPDEIDTEPDPDDAGRWSVRLVGNKYPALGAELSTERRVLGPLFREMDGYGRHEVLIESPHHSLPLWRQSQAQLLRILSVLHRRCRALAADPRIEVVQLFKNSGAAAGSSMPHPHFQLIATPVVPRQIRTKFQTAAEHYQVTGESVYVGLREAELAAALRVVAMNDAFVAIAPFASRAAYEMWLLPRQAAPTFDLAESASLPALAELLLDVLARLQAVLPDAPFNLVINSAPRRHADEPDFVWHVEILPRLSQPAGFELATGMAINPVLPEVAAERLRAAR